MARKRNIPHTYVIVFFIVVLSAMLTWFVPAGHFERTTKEYDGKSREVIVPGSFQYLDEGKPQTWQVFSAIFEGFVDKADIIVFILLIGGAFWILNDSRAIDVGIMSMLRLTRRFERFRAIRFLGVNNIILTLIMITFSVFGAVFGMSEETIAFIIIFVPLTISMGYDSITGVLICYVAASLGFAGALLNPFTIGIAQGLSDLPLYSGIEYRFVCWIVINVVGIIWTLRYAAKVHRKPALSPVYEEDQYWRDKHMESEKEGKVEYRTPVAAWIVYGCVQAALIVWAWLQPDSTLEIGLRSYHLPVLPFLAALFLVTSVPLLLKSVHFFILNLLLFTILFLIAGVMGYQWYVMEIATLFFAMGILAGISMNYGPNRITKLFLEGVKDILSAAMIVGLAGGILVILENGQVIDSILHYVSKAMQSAGSFASVSIMYGIQTMINIIIPSGSAKAALTMPMMSQFSDLIGVSRQANVMAFQFGDGFTNMITPTSGVLLGVLSVARIPYDKWVRWVWPFIIVLVLVGLLLLIPTVTMELNGF
ncbi:MAG: YfcC family protein [Bacteroidales bacterium]